MDSQQIMLAAAVAVLGYYWWFKRPYEHFRLWPTNERTEAEQILDKKQSARAKDEQLTGPVVKAPETFVKANWPMTDYNPPQIDTRSEW